MPTADFQNIASDCTGLRLEQDLDVSPDHQQFVEVLVDCPGTQGLFTYRVPPGLEIHAGDILSVPFGAQQIGAIAIRFTPHPPADLDAEQMRSVIDCISPNLFPQGYWPLLDRVAQYYHTSLMAVIRVALPPGLLQRSQRRIRLTLPSQAANDIATLSSRAQQLITLLQQSPKQDYTWTYLRRQVKGAQRGLRELQQRQWIESYLQPKRSAQPKRQQMVTLLANSEVDLTARQQEILTILKQQGGHLGVQRLLKQCHASASILKTLAQKGCVTITQQERLRLDSGPIQADQPRVLTPDQAAALQVIHRLRGFAQVLLHGVTGSGKTEVYLQAIAPVLARQESALVLVPEIGLTPQLTDRFRARFGDRVRVYHSALSEGERYDTWRYLLSGTAQVAIGTRSAVFAPLPKLGLIILDEEHDTGFKQDQPVPCYHARTVARWRGELEDCPVILGSATPSLESWAAAQPSQPSPPAPLPRLGEGSEAINLRKTDESCTSPPSPPTLGGTDPKLSPSPPRIGAHHYLQLPQRVMARPMPTIEIVDMRQEFEAGNRSMFSRKLQDGLIALQDSDQQGLLFIHRRGHSTFVSCRSCGYVVECPNCSVSLTYHHSPETNHSLLRCHYCNYTQVQPPQCPSCNSPYFRFFGSGTQRVMLDLKDKFPDLQLIRFDSDTTRRKGAHRDLLTRFAEGEADLMVGTQMLTKGIDLPQVQFVGVLAADGLLNLPDFRASERTFQTLLQVAGRSGRGDQPGQVVIQTYTPEHPVLQAVQGYAFDAFIETELQQRAALHYPPYGQLILLRLSAPDAQRVEQTAQQLATFLSDHIQAAQLPGEVLGPAPANILRVARRYRWQILLKLPPNEQGGMPVWVVPVAELQAQCPKDVRLSVDVDPLSLL